MDFRAAIDECEICIILGDPCEAEQYMTEAIYLVRQIDFPITYKKLALKELARRRGAIRRLRATQEFRSAWVQLNRSVWQWMVGKFKRRNHANHSDQAVGSRSV